jgi:DNA-binding NtrC family response regulator
MSTKILWIDDEMDSLKSQIMFLNNKGYEVETVSNGYDGLEHLRENQIDVVIRRIHARYDWLRNLIEDS